MTQVLVYGAMVWAVVVCVTLLVTGANQADKGRTVAVHTLRGT